MTVSVNAALDGGLRAGRHTMAAAVIAPATTAMATMLPIIRGDAIEFAPAVEPP